MNHNFISQKNLHSSHQTKHRFLLFFKLLLFILVEKQRVHNPCIQLAAQTSAMALLTRLLLMLILHRYITDEDHIPIFSWCSLKPAERARKPGMVRSRHDFRA